MMKFRLSPAFLMAVLSIAALIPLTFGATPEAVMGSLLLVGISTALVKRGTSQYRGWNAQMGKIGEDDIETQYKQTQANLKDIGDQLKAHAEQAQKNVDRHEGLSKETSAKVDELLMKQGELQARVLEAEQKLVNANRDTQRNETPKSAGELVVTSEHMEGVNSSFRGSRRVSVPRAAITTTSAGGLAATERLDTVALPGMRRATIRDLVAPGQTEAGSLEYVRETGFTNNAAIVAEGSAKPYSEITTALVTASVRTIAHLFKASRQILDDAKALQSYIDARARYGLLLTEESQLLYGSGAGANLQGLVPVANQYTSPAGWTVTGEQRIDRLRLALLQAELAEFPSDGIVLNPTDWALIELIKDSQGRYLIGQPQEGTAARLWNRPVVSTQAMKQNDFLVGAFKLGAQIFDRMEVEVLISTENDKDFENNMVTLRAEERLAFAIYRTEAFVTGKLTAAAAAA
ncbi:MULTISPECIES: phage major capsid protein [Pseudomonas syringae group]|uniref:Phage major capsid protein n=3 Tax=Pseudomonas syringae group TaxID=136849 RepID=A0AAE6UMX6_9PSED|nr:MULTISPECIES: phage major capsid protein [Pseudomonas syringae group]MCF5806177.1 phage major capsid protein [Pseudomonas tremae]MCF5811217.1 phage major capsid protein [Pseudomonas tremae]MCQ3014824.1 phage major capsid protein [Pseudomonas tremae]QGL56644.1 phage major capsid protein [Pseudomonas coronafaciens pv. oryzae str. 1_6]QGT81591.1 phage major capsid protein [Pseudomonas coronafaciens pv. coronafaciens]